MKAKFVFLLFCLTLSLSQTLYTQPTIGTFRVIVADTVCADLDPMVNIRFSYAVGFFGGTFGRFSTIDYGDGTSSVFPYAQNHHHYYPIAGTYQIKACTQNFNNGFWDTSCDSQQVVIQRNCSANMVADLKMKQDTACAGYPVQFGDSLIGDFSHLQFIWNFGDGVVSTQAWGGTHSYTQAGLYAASLCIIDHQNHDTSCIQQLIPVKACTNIQSLSIQGPDTVCFGNKKYDYAPIIQGGSGHFEYRWLIPWPGTLFSRGDSIKEKIALGFINVGNYHIKLKVRDIALGTTVVFSDTFVVQPGNTCPFSAKIIGNTDSVCLSRGSYPYFALETIGGSGQHKYAWNSSQGGFTGTSSSFRPALINPGMVQIDVTVTDTINMISTRDTIMVKLTQGNCNPYWRSLTISPGALCVGDSFHYHNNTGYSYYHGAYVDFGDGTRIHNKLGNYAYSAPGVYTVSLCVYNSAAGDTACYERQLWVAPQCQLKVAVETTDDFGNGDGTAHVNIFKGKGEIEFQWDSSGIYRDTYKLSGLAAGTYRLFVRDNQGLTDTVTYRIGQYNTFVYPGDCNHDQVADMQDLLPIGLHFGAMGTSRPSANLSWTAQASAPWAQTQANGRDLRHVDTDGNGLINDDDTLAIQLNYHMTHNNLRRSNTGPKLFYQMPQGPHSTGDTLRIPVHFASMDTPAVNIYGLTFGITYDTTLIKGGTVQFDYSNSWLGTKGSDLLSMYKEDSTRGQIYMGFVRKDQVSVSGYGRICDIIVVVDDHVGKRNIPMAFGFLNPYAIDEKAIEIEIGAISSATSVLTDIESSALLLQGISLGQTADALHIYHPQEKEGELHLYDIQGRLILSKTVQNNGKSEIKTSQINSGVYLLQLQNSSGLWQQKLVLIEE